MPDKPKNPAAVALGKLGGSAKTEKQKEARRKVLDEARKLRWTRKP